MSKKIAYLSLVIALVALGVGVFRPVGGDSVQTKKETAFERVMRTRTLRCVYVPRAHHFMIDAATKQKSGIDYEVMEAIGKLTHLKIDWVEETGYSSFPEQLNSGKADMLCTTTWASSAQATRLIYTAPVHFSQLFAYVRENDARFDNDLEKINDSKVTVAVLDGATVESIVDTYFPKAKKYELPILSEFSEVMLSVATRKADLSFFDELMARDYNKNTSGSKLRRVAGLPPVRIFAERFNVAMNEWALRELLNVAISDLHSNGSIDRILSKYENVPGEIMRVPPPYAAGKRD